MAEIIRMPRLSDTMEEGNIVEWQKKVGDKIEPGDTLAEVETDKATMELESYYEGTLLHIAVDEGIVPVDGLLAIIGDESEDVEKLLAENAPVLETKSEVVTHDGGSHQNMGMADSAPAAHQQTDMPAAAPPPASNTDGRVKASPLAKKIAAEKNLNLASIQGTGEGGRIVKRDVEAAKSAPAVQNVTLPSIQVPSTVEYGDHKVSQIRKVIAKRLSQSKFTAPHFYLTVEINMGKIAASRKEINADPNIKISYNDFVVKAAAMALQKHPAINSSWHDDHITVHQDINIGVAVAIDEGLVVPVVKNANLKPMTLISSEIKDLATRGRDRKLSPQEMSGNTFTISNLGSFGIDEFTAIINPPDSCILAVSSIVKKPIVVNDEIKVGSMMKVTLSCDHRIVDGATGALFLNTLKQYLENPIMMIV